MKQQMVKLLAIGATCFLLSTILFAQKAKTVSAATEMYVISAKPGGVNFVSGKVEIVRAKGKIGVLAKGDNLESGDRVLTGQNGKAEILLNPGSFLRVGENSEFEFQTASLDDLQIKLIGGSAIFEVITDKQFAIAVITPKANFQIIKSGIYRADVTADGTEKIEVWKGRAEIANQTFVKGGQMAALGGGQSAVSKFDRDDTDAFEIWSKDRSKELAKINAKLQNREMNKSLLSSFSQNRWNVNNSFGLWVRDSRTSSYCFLPFGYGWSSPYGYTFASDIWSYQAAPRIIYTSNPNLINNSGQQATPPFERMPSGSIVNNGSLIPSSPISQPPINAQPAERILERPSIIRMKDNPKDE